MTQPLARRSGPYASAGTSRAIRDAVFEELAEHGYAGLSIDAVARRAAVGKAAIYRRWPSKRHMVLALVADVATAADLFPDTGSLEGDVRALLTTAVEQLRHPLVARIVPDLLAEAARDSSFGAAMYQATGAVRRQRAIDLLRRAGARGELSGEIDEVLAPDLLAAPLYWRMTVTRQPFDERDLERLLRATLAALHAC